MNNTLVTFTGYLATDPQRRQTPNGKTVTNVRVATTERRFDRQKNQYVDGVTTFYTVTAWNWVADRVADCLQKGDPVFVSGRLVEKGYDKKDGSGYITYLEVEADAIGPDLRATSVEVIRRRQETPAEPVPAQSAPASMSEVNAPAVTNDPWVTPSAERVEPAA